VVQVVDRSIEARCAISGVGQSDIGRRLGIDPLELTLDACLAAVADAGLALSDIDGLSHLPRTDGHSPRVHRGHRH
jgi:acetyl-CoA acetyltransferase